MGKIRVRCTSLAINNTEPETEYKMVFTGDKNHIETFTSNMPDYDHNFIERSVKYRSFIIPVSRYEARPNTLLNVMGMLMTLWENYDDKLVIRTEGAEEWGVNDSSPKEDAAY